MSEFYYMRELNVGLLIFACLVDITLLIGTIINYKKQVASLSISHSY